MKIEVVEVENGSAAAAGEVDTKLKVLFDYEADWLPVVGTGITMAPFGPVRVLGVATNVAVERRARIFVLRHPSGDPATSENMISREWWASGPRVSPPLHNLVVWAVGVIMRAIEKAGR